MIYIIGIGPGGSTKYLTARALEVFAKVDEALYVGEMIGPPIRNLFESGKLRAGRLTTDEVRAAMENAISAGRDLAILVPGDPSLYSGQHGREKSVGDYLAWLRSAKAKFEVIPGISSWMALCASAGVDMTDFGTSQAVLVVSLERMITVSANKTLDWASLGEACQSRPALVLFQSYAERASLPGVLSQHYPQETEVIVGYKISWPEESIHRMPLSAFSTAKLGEDLAKHSIIIILPSKTTP